MAEAKAKPRRTRRAPAKATASADTNGGDTTPPDGVLPGLPGGEPITPPPVDEQQINAVMVYRDKTPKGPNVRVGVSGDVEVTEILTLLEMAIKFTRKELGLDESR